MKLELENIKLRPLSENDTSELAKLANNKNVSINLRDAFPFPYTLQNAKEFINICKKQNPTTTFAIEWQGKYVGNIGLAIGSDVYRKSAEIGYFIGELYWNKGIASKSVKLITEYGFNVLKIIRIHTGVFEFNKASMKVLEKNGYLKEGIKKSDIQK